MAGKRRFGRVRQLPSARWQARYLGPDGVDRPADRTFERKADADRWLAKTEADILDGDWTEPDLGAVALNAYGPKWLAERPGLRPKTRQLYDGLLRLHILPTLGRFPLIELSPARIRSWRATLLNRGVGEVTAAKAYRLLRTILATAVEDRLIRTNPCQIKGAAVERSPERPTLTVPEVYALADAMPPRFRLLVLLATFCSLRWGELVALTRAAVDEERGLIHVRSTLTEMGDGQLIVGSPKTAAGRRVVAPPPGLLDELRKHLDTFVAPNREALVFAGPKGAAPRRSNFQKHLDSCGHGRPPGRSRSALSRSPPHGEHPDRAIRSDAVRSDGAHGTREHPRREHLPAHHVGPRLGGRGGPGSPAAAQGIGHVTGRGCPAPETTRPRSGEKRPLSWVLWGSG